MRANGAGPQVSWLKYARSMEWGTVGSVRGSKGGAIDRQSIRARKRVYSIWINHLCGVHEIADAVQAGRWGPGRKNWNIQGVSMCGQWVDRKSGSLAWDGRDVH